MTEEHTHTHTHEHESKKEGFVLTMPVAVFLGLALIAGAIFFTNYAPQGTAKTPSNDTANVAMGADDVQKLLVIGSGDHVLGNPDAPVTFFEFGDFECPFCAQFHLQARRDIIEKYVNSGQVKIIWRNFPLTSIHANAEGGSEAAECAGVQGRFWEMHDAIYESATGPTPGAIQQFAKNIGLNTVQFQACLAAGTYKQRVADEFELGRKLNVSGTPTFFINGRQVVGALPFATIEPVILEALKDK